MARLFFGAALIGFSPVFVKLAVLGGVGSTAVGFWRTAGGALVLFGLAAARSRSWRLPRRALVYAALAGAAFCLDLFAWHRAIVLVGAGMSTILGNTQVFAAAVLSCFVFKEKLSAAFLAAAAVAFAGVALLVGIGSDSVTLTGAYAEGVAYGLVTGLAYATFIVCLKKGQMGTGPPDPTLYIAWATLVTALLLGLVAWMEGNPFLPRTPVASLALLGLIVLVQVVAWMTISRTLPRVATARAGLILLLQPVLAMLWGVLFFAESLTALQIVGALVTLVAMYFGITHRRIAAAGEATAAQPR